MKSEATTVAAYLASLPPDRRKAIRAVRATIRKHLPKGYVERMNWGGIAYEVPLKVCPDTYNGQPLLYAALASQKQYMAVYLCNVYAIPGLRKRFLAGFRKAGKKLDMGKSCVRFRRLEDLPLDVVGRAIASTPLKEFVRITDAAHAKRR